MSGYGGCSRGEKEGSGRRSKAVAELEIHNNIGNQIDIIVSAVVVVVRWGGRRPSQDVDLGLGEGGRWKRAVEG